MITKPTWIMVLDLGSVCPGCKPTWWRYSSATLTVSPVSRGMAAVVPFPPVEVEVEVVTELDDAVALLVDVEPVTSGETLVAGADPPQALRAPAASMAGSKIRAALGLYPAMISPTCRSGMRFGRRRAARGYMGRPGGGRGMLPVTGRGLLPALIPIEGVEQSRDD